MKEVFVFLLLVLILQSSYGQQKPQYTQYIINNYIINPAITGIENYTDVKLSHRHQWAGLSQSPVTTYFSAHTPIGKKDEKLTATSFSKNGVNIRGKQYWDEYEASPAHHGVGIQVISDKTGPLQNTSAQLTYAYHIGLNQKVNLSVGAGAGLHKTTLNTNKLFFGVDFPVDASVGNSGVIGKSLFDLSAGIWLYSDKYFLGASALQIVPQKIDFSNNLIRLVEGKKIPHLFMTAGYRFLLSEELNVLPSVMLKYASPVEPQLDVNLKAMYRDLIWFGTNYRFRYGFSAFTGVNVNNSLNVSYAYDYTTTKLNTVSNGTHEIILGFTLGNKYSMNTCPSRVW